MPKVVEPTRDIQDTGKQGGSVPRIRCPLCNWTPRAHDLWACACGYQWNTFDTGGVCPTCLHQWESTQCLKCKGWSAHSNWYEY